MTLGIPATLLGVWALWGIAERFVPRPSDPVSLRRPAAEAGISRPLLVGSLHDALRALARRQDWDTVHALADRYLKHEENAGMRLLRAEALMRRGKSAAALNDWKVLMGDGPVIQADLLALEGKTQAYRKHCLALLARTDPQTADATQANNIAWASVLLPGALPDYERPLALAHRGVTRAGTPEARANFLNTLGVALLRAGRAADAVSELSRAERLRPEPFNWPFLAMAQKRLGRDAEAARWAQRLRTHLDATAGDMSQSNRAELLLFWTEMETALEKKAPVASR